VTAHAAFTPARWLWIAIGLALVVLPVLPIPSWVGAPDTGPAAWNPALAAWGVGAAILVAGGSLIGWVARSAGAPVRPPRIPTRVFLATLAVWTAAAGAWVAGAAFAHNPHLIDEVAQLFQARVFAAGRLVAPTPEPAEFFVFNLSALSPAGWVTQFPPGHSVLLAVGLLAGVEWLVNPLLSAAAVLLVYRLGSLLYGPKTGRIAAFLWASCSWVVFMSGSYMNHVSAVFWALLAWVAVLDGGAQHAVPLRRHVIAGVALGILAATRPLDAVAAAIPVAGWMMARRRWSVILPLAAGAALPLALLGIYNARLFGSPFTFGYTALYGPAIGPGFHTDPYGEPFTPLVALSNLAAGLRRLHLYFNEWPIPALLPVGIWALVKGPAARWSDLVLALGVAAAPALYFFYWHSGFFPGPRYYFLAVPFLVIAMARAWRWLLAAARRRGALGPVSLRPALIGVATTILVWSWGWLVPLRLQAYAASLPAMKLHPERELAAAGVTRALVLVPESWGSRVIAGWWALGANAGLVERSYRSADLCDLSLLLGRARSEAATRAEADRVLDSLVTATDAPVALVPGAADPTTRLRPGSLATARRECADELARDGDGFASYGPFAWRNAPTLDRGIVFARDLHHRDSSLAGPRYAGWPVWRLGPPAPGAAGAGFTLEPLGVIPERP
jgi:hypothetical protein